MATVYLAVAILATSAALGPIRMVEAAKGNKALDHKSKSMNETISHEATIDFLVKNFDDSGDLHGSIKIGLFGNTVPMTVLNFVSLCNSVKRPHGELKYAGSYCHRLIPDMHFQCGDITAGDGSGGTSIYGDLFNDENFEVGHSEKGTVSMSNRGNNTNASQFFIIFREMRNLDGKHVAFGQIVDKASLEFLDKINDTPTDIHSFSPRRKIKIVDCQATQLKKTLSINRKVNMKQDMFD